MYYVVIFFFFKQETAYEMRISDWSSDVCSSDLFRVIADSLRLMGQVIGIHAYAVAADQAGAEWQEIPFGAGRFQYSLGIYAHFVENKSQLIDQRDIDVPLSVFDDFCRFGHAYRGRLVRARHNDLAVQLIDQIGNLRRRARRDLLDRGNTRSEEHT